MAEACNPATPLLTLEKINSSQEEMSYITRMRNVIKFQTANNEEYEYFKKFSFYNELIFQEKHEALFKVCLSHALEKVVNSRELVHNVEPFLQWSVIRVGIKDTAEAQNPVIWEQDHTDIGCIHFLASFFNNSEQQEFLNWQEPYNSRETPLFTNIHLDDLEILKDDYLDCLHKSTWRHVYDNNVSLFSCLDKDIAAYVKEQTKISKPINVFKQIINRELGEHFNQFEVLESIASPYYYVLPHQNESEYSEFESFHNWIQTTNSTVYISFSFACSLIFLGITLM
ncbi:uncharacterized protein TNCT_241721 [Trichonephila clavata]|uniref:Uncharacterized protein n=1 Tax=Trichonephila clavata TaxID=2740835 RepID=A0A8X6GAP7_TRICU|nr:uncharacterized protein TNCT_241721 [Trichonephila clavata]